MITNQSLIATQWNVEYLHYGDPMVITFVTILAFIMAVGLCGNILVLLSIVFVSGMQTHTNLLLANLAVADIIALANIPFSINTLMNGTWPHSHFLCLVNAFSVGLGLMVSLHTLMWISVHKFISITQPLSMRMTSGKIFIMMMLAWGWCIFYNLSPSFGWTDIIYRRGASQCGPTTPTTLLQRSHGLANTVFNQALPLSVATFCYIRVFQEVRIHMKRLREYADVDVQNSIIQQKRITVTLFIVLACFALCWIPYFVYSNLLIFRGEEAVPEILNPIAYIFGYMNSACNPIIYVLRLSSFRKAFGRIICGRKHMSKVNDQVNESIGAATIRRAKVKKEYQIEPQTSLDDRENIKNLSDYNHNTLKKSISYQPTTSKQSQPQFAHMKAGYEFDVYVSNILLEPKPSQILEEAPCNRHSQNSNEFLIRKLPKRDRVFSW
ncbi:unnamed protein product [Meganyctiphanes norvegica]|uniref:G-protein coupled receptors family 1 profile domain-containing protein n=1 Tax=Meganyctiphanes norvegica TaxID=48144 RepID=A0AAV2Q1S1_MEGNR